MIQDRARISRVDITAQANSTRTVSNPSAVSQMVRRGREKEKGLGVSLEQIEQ